MKTEEKRYFLDIRSGCAAVRDTKHVDYDKDYPGLHHDTCDVVEYRHGFQSKDNGWEMKQSDIDELTVICDRLNLSTTQPQPTMSAEDFIKSHFKDIEIKTEWFPALVAVADGYSKYVSRNQPIEVINESDKQDLIKIRNYFGEHDKTQLEQFAYGFLDRLIKSTTTFTPQRTEQEEADRIFHALGHHKSIAVTEYTIQSLQLRGLSTTFEVKVLTILKGM